MMTQPATESKPGSISESEFKKLCDDLYTDRHDIYSFNPNMSHREALLWMMLGCLVSLLSVPILEQPSVYGDTSSDPYADAVLQILRDRMNPAFDPQPFLDDLTRKAEAED